MLTIDQIIDLQGKGFTSEQLKVLHEMDISIRTPEPEPEKKKEPEPEPETEKKTEPEPEKKTEPGPEKKTEPDNYSGLKEEISALTETIKAMQEQNVKSAQQDKKEELTVDGIIESFMVAS